MWAPFCEIYDESSKAEKENKRKMNTKSNVEIRLFNHETNKVYYKRLTEYELDRIVKLLEVESIK